VGKDAYTAAGGHSNLDGVAARLAYIFEVEWSVASGTVDGSVDGQHRLVDTDAD